jgi:hypothetical protein
MQEGRPRRSLSLEFGFGSALRTTGTEKLGCVGLFEDELSIDRVN